MKELKILGLLVIITGVIYWGVEPLAHSIMHPHVAPADYTFKDAVKPAPVLGDNEAEYQQQLAAWQKEVDETFPALSQRIANGNAAKGQEIVTGNCVACHSMESQGFPAIMDDATLSSSYGVVPPDLSNIGYLYDSYYLFNFIKDPAVAAKVSHKFPPDGNKVHPMIAYKDISSDNEIADMVAYFNSIAPSSMDDKAVFVEACSRCHSVKYDHLAARSTTSDVNAYMGVRAIPDLSMIIRARSLDYLHTFINDPQKQLPGTSMPRVGLKENTEKQVIAYLESVGDSKKGERESLGFGLMVFFAIMAVLAYLWKCNVWSRLH